MGGTGCEKEHKFDIYENLEISACGVHDPLKNMERLANMQKLPNIHKSISLYKNINSEENYFKISFHTDEKGFASFTFTDCSGETLFGWYSASPPSPRFNEFYADKEFVAISNNLVTYEF